MMVNASIGARVSVDVAAADRARLKAIVADRNRRRKYVWRASIILLAKLSRHVAGLNQAVERTLAQLLQLQERRRAEEAASSEVIDLEPIEDQG